MKLIPTINKPLKPIYIRKNTYARFQKEQRTNCWLPTSMVNGQPWIRDLHLVCLCLQCLVFLCVVYNLKLCAIFFTRKLGP